MEVVEEREPTEEEKALKSVGFAANGRSGNSFVFFFVFSRCLLMLTIFWPY